MILCLSNIRLNHHIWCVLFALKIFKRALFSHNKISIRVNLRSYKIGKTLNFVLINEGESYGKLSKMLAGKNLRMTQKKALSVDLIKKDLTQRVKNRCVHDH